ncbi:hypothetical protein M9H77_05609 [Catharanthus roseus]|uniref:Uncharacterized protein n=1 Tax=Catharanthus roseus TaxID=4058 RepID=A0ACC0CHD5_CATRO|nr:hypothetical protein M9H77_05609 [Catharanthus roseus]
MGGDMNVRRSSSYFSGCMSPSCVPVHEEYSRIGSSGAHGGGDSKTIRSRRRLKKIIKKLMNESKSIYGGSRPLTFQYDAVSYSQNFDEGCHKSDEQYPRVIFPDFRWHLQK